MTVIRCMVGVNALAQAKYAKGLWKTVQVKAVMPARGFSVMARTPSHSSWGATCYLQSPQRGDYNVHATAPLGPA